MITTQVMFDLLFHFSEFEERMSGSLVLVLLLVLHVVLDLVVVQYRPRLIVDSICLLMSTLMNWTVVPVESVSLYMYLFGCSPLPRLNENIVTLS